jgi:hypothetical protein
MGRTIPSFRISSIIEERKWKQFCSSLDKEDKKIFDEVYLLHLINMSDLSEYKLF